MCGIAGYVDFGGGSGEGGGPNRELLEQMAYALRRRGPDARGVLIDGPCGFAHARLSIIDVEGSPQPMRVPGCPVSLVYNGELYNYQALRERLKKSGDPFVTNGDTEVILRAVARQWDKALPEFNGMFGFAAWDTQCQRLLLARDPMGEKPLFYALPRSTSPGRGAMIVFGSEIKALLMVPGVDDELDQDALRQVLRFRAVYGERSLYRGIRQLPPGCFLEFSREGVRIERYFNLQQEIAKAHDTWGNETEEDLVIAGAELLRESIQERLIADVPVGAFLSGGIDSSLIVAVMAKLRGSSNRTRTFSVGFRGDADSELPHAKLVADAIGTEHTQVQVDERIYLDRLVELTGCRDAPISEPADVAIAEMSGIARKSVKVVLSGEGADEVFGGYPKYAFAGAPALLRGAVRALGVERTSWIAGRMGMNPRRATVAARALGVPDELGRIVQWFSYLDRADLQNLLPGLGWSQADWSATMDSQAAALQQTDHMSPLGRMQMVDCLTWLPGNMLERGDRMTMAEGIEARPPFLNTRLVAFGMALSDRMKVRGRTGKWIVRQWAKSLVPRTIAQRKKWGFRVPLGQWFRGHLRAALQDYLLDPQGIGGSFGDRQAMERLLQEHESGRTDANLTLWTLLAAEVWYRDVYKKRRSSSTEPRMPIQSVA